jgi:hypothetical protein
VRRVQDGDGFEDGHIGFLWGAHGAFGWA